MGTDKTFSGTMMKKYFIVFILTFTNIVYLIPYLAIDFYTQFMEAYGLTDGQLGSLVAFYGLTSFPGYLIGGWLADRFNPKKLVVLSCIFTAATAGCVAVTSSYPILLALHLLYGITGTMLNWGAYLKLIRSLGDNEEQGRLFGAADIAYGLFSLFIQYIVLALSVTYLLRHAMGFKLAILLYAAVCVATGICVYFFVPDPSRQALTGKDDGEQIKLNQIFTVMKNPLTWYLSLFTMGYFMIRSVVPYMNPYLSGYFGVPVVFATGFTATARMLSSSCIAPVGGVIRDKMGGKSTPLIAVCSVVCIVLSVVMAWIPQTAAFSTLVMAVGTALLVFNTAMSSCLYTPVSEGKVDIAYTGTMFGIASAIGYSSDIWLYRLCGGWIDRFGSAGYIRIWYFNVFGSALMLVMGLLMWRYYQSVKSIEALPECNVSDNAEVLDPVEAAEEKRA